MGSFPTDPIRPAEPGADTPPGPRWWHWLREAAVSLLLFLVLLLGLQAWQTRDVPAGPALEFNALLVDGSSLAFSEWRARQRPGPVLLYFWADWCPVCKAQEGLVNDLARDWPLLTVAMQSGDGGQVSRHLRERGLAWTTVLDERGSLAAAYGLKGVPALVVIDGAGRISAVSVGYTTSWGIRWRLWRAGWES